MFLLGYLLITRGQYSTIFWIICADVIYLTIYIIKLVVYNSFEVEFYLLVLASLLRCLEVYLRGFQVTYQVIQILSYFGYKRLGFIYLFRDRLFVLELGIQVRSKVIPRGLDQVSFIILRSRLYLGVQVKYLLLFKFTYLDLLYLPLQFDMN